MDFNSKPIKAPRPFEALTEDELDLLWKARPKEVAVEMTARLNLKRPPAELWTAMQKIQQKYEQATQR